MANRFNYEGGAHDEWLTRHTEEILEPALPIVDAHHHLWIRGKAPYLLREFADDLTSGHNIVGSVFAECHSMYRTTGPQAERPLGEMEFIAGIAAMSEAGAFGAAGVCATAVGHVDLTLGHAAEEILLGLDAASGKRFRGVRASICWHEDERLHNAAPFADYLAHPKVRQGIQALMRLGHSLDVWCYHTQLEQVAALCDAMPDLTLILNHTGTPILGGPYKNELDTVRKSWLSGISKLAERNQVFVKLGALPAKFTPSEDSENPPSSTDIANAWAPWIEPCIELFGADRCFFESNFPVHKNWMAYPVLWNAFKLIAQGAGAEEKTNLFEQSAKRAYRWPA